MPNKEIIRVEIDDSEFSEFKKKFDAYEAAVKAMPEQWQKSGAEITAHKTQFEEMAGSIRSQAQELANLVSSQGKINTLLEGSGLALVGMAKSGKQFAGHIFQATASLRHWTKLTAIFAGLVGAGGLFGINRMAETVSRKRTSAAGLGVTYGERASFLANFGRLPGAEGLLQGFSAAETDVSKKYALRQYLGHGESGDPAKDFAEGLGRFKTLVDQTPKELLGPALRQRGYDKLGFDTETALAVKGMSRGEIEQIGRGYGADLGTRLGLSPDVSKKWTEFTTRIEKAGEDIDTILWKGTSKLTKPLEHLSEGFEHLVAALMREGGPISGWIKKLGHGISEFADALGGRTVQAKAAELGSDVAAVARLLEAIVAHPEPIAAALGIGAAARYGGGAAVAIGGAAAAIPGLGAVAGAGALGATVYPQPLNAGEDERARQEKFHQGPYSGKPGAMPKGVFPKIEPAKPGSLSGKPAVGFDTSSAVKANPAHAVDLATSKIGETINDSDIQTYLRTGRHPDPGKNYWCAMFVGASLTKAGVRDSGSDVATSYSRWGRSVDPHDVHRGDVYVRTKGRRPGQTGGHVGMLTGETRYVHGREQVRMISGNSGPRPRHVSESWEPVGGTNLIRRATEASEGRGSGRSQLSHRGDHPATMGKTAPPVEIHDNTGGQVSIDSHH